MLQLEPPHKNWLDYRENLNGIEKHRTAAYCHGVGDRFERLRRAVRRPGGNAELGSIEYVPGCSFGQYCGAEHEHHVTRRVSRMRGDERRL